MAGSPAGTNVGLKVAEAAKAALAKAKLNIKSIRPADQISAP
jgi:hypothetical protein